MLESKNIQSLIRYFLDYSGVNVYTVKYQVLRAIFKLASLEIKSGVDDINEDELYNLQYNFNHFLNGMVTSSLILYDYLESPTNPEKVEVRLFKLNEVMFLKLSEVLKRFSYDASTFGFR